MQQLPLEAIRLAVSSGEFELALRLWNDCAEGLAAGCEAALRGGLNHARDCHGRIETDEGVVRAKRIVERAAMLEPKMRSPAAGNRR